MLILYAGERISLLPGQAVLVLADGALSALRVAAPLVSGSGGTGLGSGSGLGDAPVDSPYAGSSANLGVRSSPERLAADQGNTSSNSVVAQNANPFPQAAGGLPNNPPIVIFPAALQFRRPLIQRSAIGATLTAASSANASGGALPQTVSPISALDTGAATSHLGDALGGSALTGVTDIELIGAVGDGGTQAYGGRLHTFLNRGPWSLDVALLPLKLRFNTAAGRTTRDISAVSSATLTYTSPRGAIQVGRQRFLSGPTQAALFGSVVRQGARDTMDAVRISPNIGKGRHLDLAYLYDAFPRNLPYQVPGAQKGFYGRLGVETSRGNYGLNLLHYSNLSVPTTTGGSVDFVIPVMPGQVEFYSEIGRDPFRRGVTTFGLDISRLV